MQSASSLYDPAVENCSPAALAAIPDALVYRPTAAEFRDPMAYIRTIWAEASTTGICKIIPPPGWSGAKDTIAVGDNLAFSTRLQDVHKLRWRHRGCNDSFMSYVEQCCRGPRYPEGHSLPFPPVVQYATRGANSGPSSQSESETESNSGSDDSEEGLGVVRREVDLYRLYFSVLCLGGLTLLRDEKLWYLVARELRLPEGDEILYDDLEDVFLTYLSVLPPVKNVTSIFPPPSMRAVGKGWLHHETMTGTTAKPELGFEAKRASFPVFSSGERSEEVASAGLSSVRDEPCRISCYVCHEPYTDFDGTGDSAGGSISGDGSQILTCVSCGQSCHDYCVVRDEKDDQSLFVCDSDDGTCSYGFGKGGKFTLAQYKEQANEFKNSWFNHSKSRSTCSSAVGGNSGAVHWREVEAEYWKIVEDPTSACFVRYGNDLDTKRVGSGFPNPTTICQQDPGSSASDSSFSPDAELDPWNLNILPSVCGSLLKYFSDSIKGINVPWLYCGSVFSSFCYHAEDLNMMSINYMHECDEGGGKVWYGAPSGPGALAFEAALHTGMPELFRCQPDLQYDLVTMISPVELQARGATVYRAVQRPGEYILTFPQAFHGGFSLGYNVAEAVNFFTPECFPWMRAAVRRSRRRGAEPVFDMPSFLLELGRRIGSHADLTPSDIDAVAVELEFVAREESGNRVNLAKLLFGTYEECEMFDIEPGKSCHLCSHSCNLSGLESCVNGNFYCLACVVGRSGEFREVPPTRNHKVVYFVGHSYCHDLAKRAREEGTKLRSLRSGMSRPAFSDMFDSGSVLSA